jgi:ribokinase
MIAVDEAGENMITVAPGANHEVGEDDVTAALDRETDVLVICAEIPVPALRAALAGARENAREKAQGNARGNVGEKAGGRPTVLNLAPAPDNAAAIVADGPDWLVVNESEAAAALGREVTGLDDAARAAAELVARGARHAVVTAGAHGAALADPAEIVPGFRVEAVDTVGAGDAFVGALAGALGAGVPATEAVRAAAAAGAAAATRPGAQAGMPSPADILAATGFTWPQVGNISGNGGGQGSEESRN